MTRKTSNISRNIGASQNRTGTISGTRTHSARSPYISGSAAPAVYTHDFAEPKRHASPKSAPSKNYDSPIFKPSRNLHPSSVAKKVALIAPAYKVFAGILAFVLLLGVVSVSLIVGNSVEMQKAEATQSQISEAREEAHALEVKLGALSNPTRIKGEAENLGMTSASDVVKINLTKDVVVLDDNGSLSLAGSLIEATN